MSRILVLMLIGAAAQQSAAGSLFYDKCASPRAAYEFDGGAQVQLASFAGLSCQDLRGYMSAATTVAMVIAPVKMILTSPGVREQLAGDFAAMGLTMTNPVFLSVTVGTAFGATVLYFAMKSSLEECEAQDRERFKHEILHQFERTYGPLKTSNVSLEIRR